MTHALTNEAFAALGAPKLVYVRPVSAADILAGLTPQAASEVDVLPEQTLYALHGADGARLAVLVDREAAHAAIVAHELALVSVH